MLEVAIITNALYGVVSIISLALFVRGVVDLPRFDGHLEKPGY